MYFAIMYYNMQQLQNIFCCNTQADKPNFRKASVGHHPKEKKNLKESNLPQN